MSRKQNLLNIQKIYNIIIIILILASTIFRVWLIQHKSLWLDEQYSLYFASKYSFQDLALFFSHDVHPGGFYILLKFVLIWVKDQSLLRFIFGVIPQLLGILILLSIPKYKNNLPTSLLTLCFLLLNPFFVNISWQIRMYSLIFFFSCLLLYFYHQWKTSPHVLTFVLLLITTAIGTFISYTFIIPSFCILCAIIFSRSPLSHISILSHLSLLTLFFLTLFTLFSGLNIKTQFSDLTWIEKPQPKNIASVYLSILGFSNNHPSQQSSSPFENLIFIIIVIYSCALFTHPKLRRLISKTNRHDLIFLVIIPTLLMVFVSLLVPWLSHRRYLHLLIPNISIFLPRAHTSIAVFFFALLAPPISSFAKKAPTLKPLILIISFTFFIWFSYSLKLFDTTTSQANGIDIVTQAIVQQNTPTFIWPSSFWLFSLTTSNLDFLQVLDTKMQASKSLETQLYHHPSSNICSLLPQTSTLLINKHPVLHLQSYRHQLRNQASQCCTLSPQFNPAFDIWNCTTN